jgi:hypothetical protein
VFPGQIILLPELVYYTDAKVRFADPSGIAQRFLKTQGLLLIGKGFLIFPLTLRTERQRAALHDCRRGSGAMGLSEQTQGVCDALLILSRLCDLFCLEDGRKHEISFSSVKKVINGEDLSIQKQELEAILLCYLACFYHVQRCAEHMESIT